MSILFTNVDRNDTCTHDGTLIGPENHRICARCGETVKAKTRPKRNTSRPEIRAR